MLKCTQNDHCLRYRLLNPHICFVTTPSNLTSRFEVDIVLHEEENCHRCANRWMHQVLNGVEGVPRNKFPCHGVQVFSYDIGFSGNWSNMKTTPFIQQKNHPHSFCYCWILLQMSNGLFGYNWTKSGMHDARPHVWKLTFVHVVQASRSFITKSGKKHWWKQLAPIYSACIRYIAILDSEYIFINVHHADRNEPCVEFLQWLQAGYQYQQYIEDTGGLTSKSE